MKTKNIILPILLLLSGSFAHAASPKSKMLLDDPLLKLVDGIAGAMDAAAFKKCFDTWSVINNLQYKDTYALGEKNVTLKDVVMLEVALNKKGTTKDNSEYKALTATLNTIKESFKAKTEGLLKEAESEATKETNKKLIALQLAKRNKKDSILNAWGKADQDKLLLEASGKKFFVFLNDLKQFLEDLMYSCPKARKSFKEQCLKPEDHASFDAFFTN